MSPKESSRIESLEAEIKRLKGKQKAINHDSLMTGGAHGV